MLDENKEVFDAFAKLHFEYSINEDAMQEKFNTEGEKVLIIIREYEDRLCRNTERGVYNKFSGGLSEKFQQLVRAHFPLIDHIGLIVSQPNQQPSVATEEVVDEEPFTLKKLINNNHHVAPAFAAADSFTVKKINL